MLLVNAFFGLCVRVSDRKNISIYNNAKIVSSCNQ